MSEKNEVQNIVLFLFETGLLKRLKRSGWWVAGISNPESVAEHSFRCAILGYLLSKKRRLDVAKTVLMCLLHDVGETRTGDLHRLAKRYLGQNEITVIGEQLNQLPADMKREITSLLQEFASCSTEEARTARDADTLECALQAKEYETISLGSTAKWIEALKEDIRTELGKEVLEVIEKAEPTEWWSRLLLPEDR